MKKVLSFLCLCCYLFAEANFIGILGKTYPIAEENGLDYIERRAKEITPEMIEKEEMKNINRKLTSTKHLPLCKANRDIKINLLDKAKQAFAGKGILFTDQAQKHLNLILKTLKVDYFVMDISDNAQIAYAKKKGFKNALIMGGYIYDASTDFIENRYMFGEDINDIFNIKCTPTYITYNPNEKSVTIQEIYLKGDE